MQFTEYGQRLADNEADVDPAQLRSLETPDQRLRYMTRQDRGNQILVTGEYDWQRYWFSSVVAAFAYAVRATGLRYAWHLRADGTRKMVWRP
jgi:hypothetical protein